jgi:hypothetical protein
LEQIEKNRYFIDESRAKVEGKGIDDRYVAGTGPGSELWKYLTMLTGEGHSSLDKIDLCKQVIGK